MRTLHLFAGAGGGLLGDILLGHSCVCAVELEDYRRKVLLQRQRDGILPRFPIWDDIKTFDGKPWKGKVDVVAGGFPCQDISYAGKGAGIVEGKRSSLWFEMQRVVREVGPSLVFVENSPALTIRGLETVLAGLAALRYNAVWGVFSAGDAGARHERERLFILADSHQKRFKGLGEHDFMFAKSGIQRRPAAFGDPSDAPRASDGVANRMDRLEATGDGQVPAVVELAWKTLYGRINL